MHVLKDEHGQLARVQITLLPLGDSPEDYLDFQELAKQFCHEALYEGRFSVIVPNGTVLEVVQIHNYDNTAGEEA